MRRIDGPGIRDAGVMASVVAAAGLLLVSPVFAQPPEGSSASVSLGNELTTPQREQLFQELQSQVADFQRHHTIVKTLTRLVSPTVVHIDAKTSSGRGRNQTVEEAGSGVVIEHQGAYYVITNRHVIKSAGLADITIRFDNGEELHPSRVIGDEQTDVAVMAITGTNRVASRIGRSANVETGDSVVAVGSPFGLAHSVTLGIISAKGRRDLELGEGGVQFQDFMQTDAAINPGNSGGPLFNLRGEVIGINTAIASGSGWSEGVGFAIPIDMAITVAKQLIERGSVLRAKLGVTLDSKFTYEQARNSGLPRLVGARVIKVGANSVAEKSGIKVGDIVVRFGGQMVDNDTHLVSMISTAAIDTDLAVEVVRDRKITRLTAHLVAP